MRNRDTLDPHAWSDARDELLASRRVRPLRHSDDLPRIARLCRAAHRRNVTCERSSVRRLPTFGLASYYYILKREAEEAAWIERQYIAEQAHWAAWEASDEGRAHRAEMERINEETWAAPTEPPAVVTNADEDLPF